MLCRLRGLFSIVGLVVAIAGWHSIQLIGVEKTHTTGILAPGGLRNGILAEEHEISSRIYPNQAFPFQQRLHCFGLVEIVATFAFAKQHGFGRWVAGHNVNVGLFLFTRVGAPPLAELCG